MLTKFQYGPTCLATNSTDETLSEDCLFVNVFAPARANAKSKLPVYFFIQGGGFNSNSNPNFNGRGLIHASGGNIVVVNFNYRVGPYGFLASREIQEKASLNNGLKDQLKALEWVQKYISKVLHTLSLLLTSTLTVNSSVGTLTT